MEQMVNGEPIMEACCRTGVGGFHVTSYLKRLLSLQHPYHLYGVCFPSYTLLSLVWCLFSLLYTLCKSAESITSCILSVFCDPLQVWH
jgi:hypothetical protein